MEARGFGGQIATYLPLTPATCNRSLAGITRDQALRLAGDRHEQPTAVEALGDTLGVLEGDGIDHALTALHIIDAEIVELDLGQLGGDLVRRVEAERVGVLEVGLGRRQLFGGRA